MPSAVGLKIAAIMLIAFGLFLIIGGTFIIGSSFHDSRFPTFSIRIFQNDPLADITFGWKVKIQSRVHSSGITKTNIRIENDFDGGFTMQFPNSLPEGICFLQNLRGTDLKNASARIFVIDEKVQHVEGPWVKNEEINRYPISIPIKIEQLPNLENYLGINYLVKIDVKEINKIWNPQKRIHFEFLAEFDDSGYKSMFNKYRSGIISVHAFASASEYRFLGIKKRKFTSNLDMPGLYLETIHNKGRISQLEFSWEPDIKGFFESPDEIKGAKIFWDEQSNDPIEASFTFRASGALWLPYIGAILGLPILGAGVNILRKIK